MQQVVHKLEFGLPCDVTFVEIKHLVDEIGCIWTASTARDGHLRIEALWRTWQRLSHNLLVLFFFILPGCTAKDSASLVSLSKLVIFHNNDLSRFHSLIKMARKIDGSVVASFPIKFALKMKELQNQNSTKYSHFLPRCTCIRDF